MTREATDDLRIFFAERIYPFIGSLPVTLCYLTGGDNALLY
jgi:hypothetical protein